MAKLTDLATAARKSGLPVVEIAGWKTRGRPASTGGFNPKGVMAHHTGDRGEGKWVAEGILSKGRSGLPGPLCQLALGRDGTVYVVAAGRANHAGAGKTVKFMKAGDGNSQAIGIEAMNNGSEGWTTKQLNAYHRLCAALCDHYGWSRDNVVGHGEFSSAGKWDPGISAGKMMSMSNFRTAVKAVKLNTPTDTAQTDKMSPGSYFIGANGAHVTWLGERLVMHLKALSITPLYTAGPGPTFTETDRRVVAQFQEAQGWTGSDADGFPGPTTLKLLAADPKPVTTPTPVPVTSKAQLKQASLNAAGYNALGATNYSTRVKNYGSFFKAMNPHQIFFQEISHKNAVKSAPLRSGSKDKRQTQRDMTDAALSNHKRAAGGSDGRYIYHQGTKRIASGVFNANKANLFNGDTKQAAWLVDELTDKGKKYRSMEVSFHLEHENGRDKKTGKSADDLRVAQILDFLNQTLAVAKKYEVPVQNITLAGDANSDNMVRRAMEARGFKVVGRSGYGTNNKWKGSVKGDDPIDYGFVHEDAKVIKFQQHRDAKRSDHDALSWTRELVA